MSDSPKTRVLAAQVMYQVVNKHQHLKQAMQHILPSQISAQDKAWVQNICYQSLRHHHNLEARWQKFVTKPLKDKLIAELMTLSMAQKVHLNTPHHAIVNEAIIAAKKLKKQWAAGLLNKVLKLAVEEEDFKPQNEVELYCHPQWWIDLLKKDWPKHYTQILTANNQHPPLWIRTRVLLQDKAGTPHSSIKSAWRLNDTQTSGNLALAQGEYSVQDAAAQYAALLINPQAGEKILDACAAPGGKSCHLLELEPGIQLDILEKDPKRLLRVEDNLNRLSLSAHRIIQGDATDTKAWFQGEMYDKILLDVPCSASGVVRRNPDIKLLRQNTHLKQLTTLQHQIIMQMASLLKIGGQMLYVTCSVFRSENERQIKKFLKQNPTFKAITLNIQAAEDCLFGQQIITGTEQMDGFYYCLLEKTA
ncbi:MAG: 16S rRNA (cytosine(967)-C(5))-methyltransferase RsmB [Marinicella sp.]